MLHSTDVCEPLDVQSFVELRQQWREARDRSKRLMQDVFDSDRKALVLGDRRMGSTTQISTQAVEDLYNFDSTPGCKGVLVLLAAKTLHRATHMLSIAKKELRARECHLEVNKATQVSIVLGGVSFLFMAITFDTSVWNMLAKNQDLRIYADECPWLDRVKLIDAVKTCTLHEYNIFRGVGAPKNGFGNILAPNIEETSVTFAVVTNTELSYPGAKKKRLV